VAIICRVFNRPPLTDRELLELKRLMSQLVQADLAFERQIVPLSEAIDYFRKEKKKDKVNLLIHQQKPYLTLYHLDKHLDYHHGYMVPSSGYLSWFELSQAGEAFTLRFPRRARPTTIEPLPDYPRLLAPSEITAIG
jgi:uridine kinase